MGDCLLLTSPIRALKQEFPGFRIYVLAEPRFADCFDGNPDIEGTLTTSEEKYETVSRLFLRRFHAIVNLHGGPTSLVYSCAAWGRRIGVEDYQYSRAYSGLVPRPKGRLHTVETTMEWFRWLGVRAQTPPGLHYERHPKENERIRDTIQGRPYVVMHPAALMDTKRWAAERFAELGGLMTKRGWSVVLTCGPNEEPIVGQVAGELPKSIILFGLSIPELAELIRGATLFIGNDSGPMHLAAAVGTPTIAVWGSSDSVRWRPWGVPHRVIQNPFECNPCPGYNCLVAYSPLCIESVSTDQVSHAVRDLMRETEARQSEAARV
jgi:heptosyltransferase-3